MHGHWRTGLACAALLALAGDAGAGPAPHPVPGRTTVLPLSEGRHLPEKQTSGCWTPSTADLKNLEADLPKRLIPYYRQYLGITERGNRLIYIDGFKAQAVPEMMSGKYDWHRHAVFVFDGGDNFFQATYDPALRNIARVSFNGPYLYVPKSSVRR